MKFKFFCMLGTIAVLSSCNNKNDSDVVSQRFVHKYGFDLSEAEWIQRDKEGQVITTLKNGITKNTSYKNGILHGPTTITFPNTNIIQEKCEYNEGMLVKKTIFELSGLPVQENAFEADGKKIITIWDNNGVPLSMEEYNNDLLMSARYYNSQNEIEATIMEGAGTRIKRDRSSLLLSKEKVENGQIVKRTTFHPNGVVHTQCSFANYKLNGLEETFSPSGNLLSRSNWKMGKLDGIQSLYHNNKIHTEISYADGKKNGPEKEYDSFGLVSKEINWADDQRHGPSHYTTKDSYDMQWFWRGAPVERKKFQLLKFREELIAQLNGEKPLKSNNIIPNENEQIVLEDEMNIKSEESEKDLVDQTIENFSTREKEDTSNKENSTYKEELKSLSDIKAEIKALKEKQKNKIEKTSKVVQAKKPNKASPKQSNKQIAKKEQNAPKSKEEPKQMISNSSAKVENSEIKKETKAIAAASESKEQKAEVKQEIADAKTEIQPVEKSQVVETPTSSK